MIFSIENIMILYYIRLVFVTKYSRGVFTTEILDELKQVSIRQRMYQF